MNTKLINVQQNLILPSNDQPDPIQSSNQPQNPSVSNPQNKLQYVYYHNELPRQILSKRNQLWKEKRKQEESQYQETASKSSTKIRFFFPKK